MTDQEKEQEQTTAETEPTEAKETEESHEDQPSEQTDRLKETTENIKETSEKIWGSTKHAWNTAAFKAVQYKKLVQMKIDQSALHKKINAAHGDLGKLIDDLREAGKKNILNLAEVKQILTRIDEFKAESAALEEETERIRTEDSPQEEAQEETPKEEKSE